MPAHCVIAMNVWPTMAPARLNVTARTVQINMGFAPAALKLERVRAGPPGKNLSELVQAPMWTVSI